jgi:predicted nucleic acid-binding protein
VILADTSVWVDHFRKGEPRLADLLAQGRIAGHPLVIGELACGALRRREEILGYLSALPCASVASHAEALHFAGERKLHAKGLGWIDVHLLASAVLTGCALWTKHKTLASAARMLGVDA